jgi:hypothetical protein
LPPKTIMETLGQPGTAEDTNTAQSSTPPKKKE